MSLINILQSITIEKEISGERAFFKGTRVPVDSLFDHLEAGLSIDEFLKDFPTVKKDMAIAALRWANKLLNTENPALLYQLAKESQITSKESMSVLHEFERLED